MVIHFNFKVELQACTALAQSMPIGHSLPVSRIHTSVSLPDGRVFKDKSQGFKDVSLYPLPTAEHSHYWAASCGGTHRS